MPYTVKNCSSRFMAMFYCLNLALFPCILSAQTPPQACPMYVYEEPVLEKADQSYGAYSQTAMSDNALWRNMDYGTLSDELFLEVDLLANQESQLLNFNNFNIRIPEGAQINGIQLVVEGKSSQPDAIKELVVNLQSGSSTSLNLANYATYGLEWQEEKSVWIYGTKDYLWDMAWTSSMVMDPSFGAKIQIKNSTDVDVTALIDKVSVRIYYTPLYTICDHDCVVFFVDEIVDATNYNWIVPQGFQRLSGDYEPNIINIGKTTATPGIYEMCMETISNSGTSEPCCRSFRVDDCRTSSIGDFVWNDMNGNGVQDTEDYGIANVKIDIYSQESGLYATTYTDQNGFYQFTDLQKGYYSIRLSNIPSGFVATEFGTTNSSMDSNTQMFGQVAGTSVFYIDPGMDRTDFDFGFYELSKINGLAWQDMNYNGVQDIGEPFIPNISVNLLDNMTNIIASTTTDAQGNYSFINLIPGTYQVQVDTQDYLITHSNIGNDIADNDFDLNGYSAQIDLISGTIYNHLDIGLYQTASVGDFTWIDIDRDGVQDPEDIALDKTWIKLYNANDELIAELDVDIDGKFLFENLVPGEYYFVVNIFNNKVQPAMLQVGNDAINSETIIHENGHFASIPFILQSGEINLNIDLGFEYIPSSISGYVWEDNNGDGIQNNTETTVDEVFVNLLDANGTILHSTEVRPDGSYLFDVLNPGNYQLEFATMPNYIFTQQNIGEDSKDSDVNTDGKTDIITLAADQNIVNVSAGYMQYSSISDLVFLDYNRNGIQDNNESGIEGITLQLYDYTSSPIQTVTTDSNGSYKFDQLLPGTYYIIISPDEKFIITQSNVGMDDNIDSDMVINDEGQYQSAILLLTSGTILKNQDFGFQYVPATISGYVWEDFNANGVFEQEDATTEGINVHLYNDNDQLVASTTTDVHGQYEFNTLDPIQYYVRFDFNSLQYSTYPNITNENLDSDITNMNGSNTTDWISLNIGEDKKDVTAGYFTKAKLGNYVWLDDNYNGIQDIEEHGLAGIHVSLFDKDNNNIGSVITQEDGYYMFESLRPNPYHITVQYQEGLDATLLQAGNNIALDSDLNINDNMGVIPQFVLQSGEENLDLDFGFIELASISGLVWEDLNYDGIRQSDEPILSNIKVDLIDNIGNIIATSTTMNGSYTFEGLLPNSYSVNIDKQDYLVTKYHVGNESVDNDFNTFGESQNIVLTSGTDYQYLDAGLYHTANLGNYLWIDINRDGIQDNTDLPLVGVIVSLFDESGQLIDETKSTTEGLYNFTNLNPGSYYINIDSDQETYILTTLNATYDEMDSDGIILSDDRFGTNSINLISNETNNTLDIGLQYRPSSIQGYVWLDYIVNGIKDASETVTTEGIVSLIDYNGNTIATKNLDEEGLYIFDNLNPGKYYVQFSIDDDLIFTFQNVGNEAFDSDVNSMGLSNELILEANQNLSNISAGYYQYASIGDYVFLDINRDGIQNAGDLPMAALTLQLYNNDNILIASTTTGEGGYYTFDNLIPDVYYIVAPTVDNLTPTITNASTNDNLDSDLYSINDINRGDNISLTSGNTLSNQDLGYQYIPSSISGFAWEDHNANGIFETTTDSKLENIVVNLYSNSGMLIASTTTDTNGDYLFDNLDPIKYYVQFEFNSNDIITQANAAADDVDSDVTGFHGMGTTSTIELIPNSNIIDVAAGIYGYASVGDYVWLDVNNDGIQNNNELGIEGVSISLLNNLGNTIATTSTDMNGYYQFDNIMPSIYQITIEYPNGFDATTKNIGNDTNVDSDIITDNNQGITSPFELTSRLNNNSIDMGLIDLRSTISGLAFIDNNGNGLRDNNELLLPSIAMSLYDNNSNLLDATQTDESGNYTFTDILADSYYVVCTLSNGYYVTGLNQGAPISDNDFYEVSSIVRSNIINVLPMTNNDHIDVGMYQLVNIGDQVWIDANENGIKDSSESGQPGLIIELLNGSGSTIATATTDNNGMYLFENYPPGLYQIKLILDNQYVFTESGQGNNPSVDSDISIISFDTGFTPQTLITSGTSNFDLDIGLLLQNKASISGLVWLDRNQDASYIVGEELLEGITVNLFNNNNTLISTASTNASGQYLFSELFQGNYYIQFIDHTGAGFTTANATNDNMDSDVDNSNGVGTTSLINLNFNTNATHVDAGILPLDEGAIRGNIWDDANANGVFDTGEFPIKNILVQLFNMNGSSLVSMMTTGTGMYTFEHLPAGQYYIMVSSTQSYAFTDANKGMDDTIDSDITEMNGVGTSDVITLNQNQIITDIDAGLLNIMNSSVKGLVWNDLNNNGLRDDNEPLRPEVEIVLHNNMGVQVANTTTNELGMYKFNDLFIGDYYLTYTDIMNEGPTTPNAGNDDTIDSDFDGTNGTNSTATLTLGINQTINNIDLGLIMLANSSINGITWNDENKNGLRESTEMLLDNIPVRLLNATGVELATTMSINGAYSFSGLTQGNYIIHFGSLNNYNFTTSHIGSNTSIDSDVTNANGAGTTEILMLAQSTSLSNIDAGYSSNASGSIMGLVWQDISADGIRDNNEPTNNGVTVNLYNQGNVVATTMTDINGQYQFGQLLPGLYNIEFVDPFGYGFTVSNVGMDDTVDSDITNSANGLIENVFILLNTSISNMDAGLASPNDGLISGKVWSDDNRNGLFDNSEMGLVDVTVKLLDQNGMTINSTITNVNGGYSFNNLIAGSYIIEVIKLNNQEFTTAQVGTNTMIDSDITESNGEGTTDIITISGTQSALNVDAGIRSLANSSVSGLVFDDLNADGLRDDNDPLWQGITVSLFDANNMFINSVVTDNDGAYTFGQLVAGMYYLTFNKPSTSNLTTANAGMDETIDSDITESISANSTDIFTLDLNGTINNIDAGFYTPASIAGAFFFDENDNGVIDPADMSLESRTVILQDPMGNMMAQTMTNSLGLYQFNGITPGSYTIAFVLNSTEEITIANASSNELIDSDVVGISNGNAVTSLLTIISNDDIQGVNAGVKDIPQFINISGLAWEDIDGDGERETGDPVLSGYTATLYNAAGTMISSTTTGTDGRYSFDNLPTMSYYVVFTLPSGQGFTYADATADNIDSDITASQVAGSTDLISTNINTLDAGFYKYASIGDRVWNDFNNNGILDDTESGINTIKIRLYSADGTLISTRFSNTDNATGLEGVYQFSGLRPGGYYIKVEPSNGMFFTTPNIGSDDTIDSDVNSANGFGSTPIYVLSSGENETTVDVGLLQDPADVGDRTWVDYNGNGIQDADEPGLNNVKVELYTIDNELIATTYSAVNPSTLQDGRYSFTNVQPGAYYMVFTPPTGYLNSIADQGGNDAKDSDVTSMITQGSTNIVNLSSGENEKDIDAGFYEPAGLGNFVWEDINKNGLQDQGEPGIPNVSVSLRRPNGTVISSTTTNASGMYSFGGLTQGVYFVTFSAPNGYMFTTQDAGPDNIDSDVNITGNSPLISLAHGVEFSDLDAGIYVASSLLGSYVWMDFNKDGIQTANEKGIENVQVNLLNMSGAIVESTITDFDGKYLFYNMINSNYTIQFIAPEHMAFTIQNNGTDDNRDSDVNANGMTSMITVNNNYNMHVDAGLYMTSGINGNVNEVMTANILSGQQKGDFNLLQWDNIESTVIALERKHTDEADYHNISNDVTWDYTFEDFNILKSGMYEYRLLLQNDAGVMYYSNDVHIMVQYDLGFAVDIIPNPVRDHGQLLIKASKESYIQWTIFDNSGRTIRQSNLNNNMVLEGDQILDFNVEGLRAGTYIMLIELDHKVITKKLIIIE